MVDRLETNDLRESLQKIDKKHRDIVKGMIRPKDSSTTWEDIVGLNNIRDSLRRTLLFNSRPVWQKTVEAGNDSRKKLERFKALVETADAKNREKETLYQTLLDEKEKLEERCDKMQNHLSRGGTEAEVNMARNEARELKEELAQRKKGWIFQDEENKKEIDSLLKKVSNLEIEDKINMQELKKEKEIIKKLQMETKNLSQSQVLGSGDENPFDEDFDNDSGTEDDYAHRRLGNGSGSLSGRKPRSTHVNEERESRLKKDSADIESFFRTFGGTANVKQSTKDTLQESVESRWEDDADEEGGLEDKRSKIQKPENNVNKQSIERMAKKEEASVESNEDKRSKIQKPEHNVNKLSIASADTAAAVEPRTKDDGPDESNSDNESEEESGEKSDDESEEESEGDSDEESEEEKHGWEELEHIKKHIKRKKETIWERPAEYESPAEESSEDDEPLGEEEEGEDSKKGPAALFLERMAKKEEASVESNEDKRSKIQKPEHNVNKLSIASADTAAAVEPRTKDDGPDESNSDNESEEESGEKSDDESEEESEGDSDEESEEEKHGWEELEHIKKHIKRKKETIWERPAEYESPAEESSEDDEPLGEEEEGEDSKKGPAALFLERMAKKEEASVESNEKEILQKFLSKLEAGIPIKKFPNSSGWFSSGAQARTIWLNTSNNALYWQKGRKDTTKVKLESSVRMKDIMTVSLGIKSDVLRRLGTSKNSDLYLSLQCASGTRNLDIEAKDREQRNYLAIGFKLLLKQR